MQSAIIKQTIEGILHSETFPSKLIKSAESLIFQSSTIPLKPHQEPARIYICSVIAALRSDLASQVDQSRPPLPPPQYSKLLQQFQSQLFPNEVHTPRKPRRARRKAANYLESQPLDFQDPDSDGDYINSKPPKENDDDGMDLIFDSDDAEVLFNTPQKRPPPSKLETSPRKSPRKSGPQPTLNLIKLLCVKMALPDEPTEAILNAYALYKDMVKEPYGLIYGLIYIVSERSQPKPSFENARLLKKAFGEHTHQSINSEEWISYTSKIVSGQTWLDKVSIKSEPVPQLYGLPGGWGQP